jgi:hypothetical protein
MEATSNFSRRFAQALESKVRMADRLLTLQTPERIATGMSLIRRAPLIFVVPACGFVVAARIKQFQLDRRTGEQISCPDVERNEPRSKALIIKPLWIN